MMLVECLEQKKMSMYRLAQSSGIPYATVHDICSGKTKLEKCSAETVYRMARALGTTMEELLSPCLMTRNSFELFKSSICHRVSLSLMERAHPQHPCRSAREQIHWISTVTESGPNSADNACSESPSM